MLEVQDQARLDALFESMEEATRGFLGYPVARDFDYSPLFRFLQFPSNNIGDPFQTSTYRVGSRDMEREYARYPARYRARMTHVAHGFDDKSVDLPRQEARHR